MLACLPTLRSRVLTAVEICIVLYSRALVACYGLAVMFAGIGLVTEGSAPWRWVAACGWVFKYGTVILLALIVAWAVAQTSGLFHRPRTPARTTVGIVILLIVVPLILAPEAEWHMGPRRGPVGHALSQMRAFAPAIDSFHLSNKRLPRDLEELTRSGDRSPYPFIERIPPDPWGNPYAFRRTEPKEPGATVAHYVISSNGCDGEPSTDDDVVYSSRNGFRHWED